MVYLLLALVLFLAVSLLYHKRLKARTEAELKRYQAEESYEFDEANVTGFHKKLERLGR